MSASAEVASLPGGGVLAAFATDVRGNPGAIRDMARRWSQAAGECASHAGAVRAAVADVGHDWQGASASAFATFMGRFGDAGSAAEQALAAAAATLRGIAGALEEAQVGVEAICETLLGEVSRLRAANPEATSADLDGHISRLTADAAAAARPKVDEARLALGRARVALSGDLSRLSRTFSALPQPGTAGFLRTWTTPYGWSPAPPPGTPAPAGSAAGTPAPAGSAASTAAASAGGSAASAGAGQTVTSVQMSGPASPAGPASPQQVDAWINQATRVLGANGIPTSNLSPQDIWIIIQHESGGDPGAVNNWDGNAAAGTPSTGLMQTIAPTFNAYALPGYGDIYNPVDNIIAGVRYALARYGSLDGVPGVVAVRGGQPYVGY